MRYAVFLFGEAEKGVVCKPRLMHSLLELISTYGHPQEETLGLFYAIQVLLYERDLIYFRVREEGMSIADYMKGLKILQKGDLPPTLTAICMPNVSDAQLLNQMGDLCCARHWFLLMGEKDLYDYLTADYLDRKAG